MAERPRKRPPAGTSDATRRRAIAQRKHRAAPPPPPPPAAPGLDEPVRLNRFLARAGVASRRDADELIAAGRVTVNGETVTEMGRKVAPDDRVQLDGRPVSPTGPVYILLNKPKDTITTTDDEKGRRTVMELLDGLPEAERAGLFPVGRLDRGTTGALVLTNDGDLAHRLMHPRYTAEKLYLVRAARSVTPDEIDALRRGVTLEDGRASADQIGYVSDDKSEVALSVHEGRNRLVRRMFEAIGAEVVALDRVSYAGLTLAGLRRGRWRRLEEHEVNALRRLVKLKPILFEKEKRGGDERQGSEQRAPRRTGPARGGPPRGRRS